jgi:adenosylhomocysteine nucleosidase
VDVVEVHPPELGAIRGCVVIRDLFRGAAPVLVVTGMASEARLAAGAGVVTITGRAASTRLSHHIGCRAVLSFGMAGALDPTLAPGDVIVASTIVSGTRSWQVDARLAQRLADVLGRGAMRVVRADLLGVDAPLLHPRAKEQMRRTTGAAAVDMESHRAAAYAAEHRIPFASLRVICDPAERTVPPLAVEALLPNGRVNIVALIASVLRHPRQVRAMTRVANDARTAFWALHLCRQLLGAGLGVPDLAEAGSGRRRENRARTPQLS